MSGCAVQNLRRLTGVVFYMIFVKRSVVLALDAQYAHILSESCENHPQNQTFNSMSFCFNITSIEIPKGYIILNANIALFHYLSVLNRRHLKKAVTVLQRSNGIGLPINKPVKVIFVNDKGNHIKFRRKVSSSSSLTEDCNLEVNLIDIGGHNSWKNISYGNMTIRLAKPICDQGNHCTLLNDASVSLLETNVSNCVEYCNTLPNNEDSFSYIPLSMPHQHQMLNSTIIYGSGYGCRFSYSVWIHPEINITVILHTSSINKVIDIQQFKIFDRKWHNVEIDIGKLDEPFFLTVNVYSMYHVAFRSFGLSNCGNDSASKACNITNQFTCSTGHCIEKITMCDLEDHCFYGEDESYSRCGASDVFSRCDFDAKSCGWNTNDPTATCQWERKQIDDDSIQPNVSMDKAWFLFGYKCERENHATLILPLRTSMNTTNCYIRLYYLISGKASIFIQQCNGEGDCEQLSTIHGNYRDMKWKSSSLPLPTSSSRFQLHIHGEFSDHGRSPYIALDNISFTQNCFTLDTDDVTRQEMYPVDDSDTERSEIIPIVVGSILGLISGSILILLAYIVCKQKETKSNQRTYRKISTNSTASTLLFGIKKPDSTDKCYDSDTGRPFLNSKGATGMSSVSPLYDWTQINDVMHIIPRNKITIKRMLGKGAFGEVYYGLLADVARLQSSLPVAVKMLPTLCSEQSKSEFFVEAVLLSKLRHPNIVRFLGISLDDSSLYLLLELMEGGDLKSFVRECRINGEVPSIVRVNDLLKLCLDVANGCEYLEQNKFIHRDIAARNCLLTEKGPNRVAKIADFGMTKNVFSTNYYRKNGMAMVPVKWMPPEAFHDGVFTTKTDVWGFGIVLWEVFTLGHIPYPGKSNNEVMTFVAKGGRLNKPDLCPDKLYALMLLCWEENPDNRPNFKRVSDTLIDCQKRQMILSEENLIYCEIDSQCTTDDTDIHNNFHKKDVCSIDDSNIQIDHIYNDNSQTCNPNKQTDVCTNDSKAAKQKEDT